MDNASARNIWGDYLDKHLEYAFVEEPRVTHFCDNEKDANTCLNLVMSGKKQATTHSLLGLQMREERLPKIGDFTIVTDWAGKAKCIIRTVRVRMRPYFSIDEAYSRLEGEGDGSLAYWQQTHWDYYTRELEPYGRVPRESMILVCEEFEKVYPV